MCIIPGVLFLYGLTSREKIKQQDVLILFSFISDAIYTVGYVVTIDKFQEHMAQNISVWFVCISAENLRPTRATYVEHGYQDQIFTLHRKTNI